MTEPIPLPDNYPTSKFNSQSAAATADMTPAAVPITQMPLPEYTSTADHDVVVTTPPPQGYPETKDNSQVVVPPA